MKNCICTFVIVIAFAMGYHAKALSEKQESRPPKELANEPAVISKIDWAVVSLNSNFPTVIDKIAVARWHAEGNKVVLSHSPVKDAPHEHYVNNIKYLTTVAEYWLKGQGYDKFIEIKEKEIDYDDIMKKIEEQKKNNAIKPPQ